ncbi:MAG TPA: acyl-CoA thioesterase [Ignavibacteriaceae bacterium]|jgi:acyl-CoA hydrolase|nr:MAG: putative acyl-CoA thioester hydrolase [Ignavibacteria bacterium ADurb.Bin266]OQY70974.1 MAG: acyl-CoA thioesterase [Ignavibacteriales bacterium UTCHB2]HQF41564.1 acyl-CoA thioesterase [Ignavibacteriaceae bacterium]HQI42074.1 acyl-CoA thioesterase [Ignavibacteriaceae bacterium]
MSKAKKISDSQITMTELVLPHHTNQLGNLLGGQLMHWIDICAALSAAKHNQRVCVTASVDRIDFHHPIKLGEAVTLVASINRVFKTSMEVGVKVFAQNFKENKKVHTNTAYLTFVGVDADGKPVEAIEGIPETEDEKRRYDEALQRRENRLKNRIH